MGTRGRSEKAGAQASGRFAAEQRVGGGAVRGSLVAVRLDPGDLGFEQFDAFRQFGQRIGIKAFLRQRGSGVTLWPRKVFVHAGQNRTARPCCQLTSELGLWGSGLHATGFSK